MRREATGRLGVVAAARGDSRRVRLGHGFLPFLRLGPREIQLDALLTESSVMWQRD